MGNWRLAIGETCFEDERNVSGVEKRIEERAMAVQTNDGNGFRLDGVVSLLLTPFQPDGAIDWRVYDQYVEWQAAQEPSGLFAVCGSSEMKWLTLEERLELATRAVDRAGGLPVVATANLGDDVALHRDELAQMAATGIAAAVLIPPPAISGDAARYRDYLFALSDGAPCPLILYEWPLVPNHTLDAELFGELAAHGAIVGVKDTTCTVEGIAAKQRVAGATIIYQANTALLPDALDLGVQGIMAITSTARADLVLRFWQSYHDDAAEAQAIHRELVTLDALLEMAYPATAKYLVSLQGVIMPTTTRWPATLRPHQRRALEIWQRG